MADETGTPQAQPAPSTAEAHAAQQKAARVGVMGMDWAETSGIDGATARFDAKGFGAADLEAAMKTLADAGFKPQVTGAPGNQSIELNAEDAAQLARLRSEFITGRDWKEKYTQTAVGEMSPAEQKALTVSLKVEGLTPDTSEPGLLRLSQTEGNTVSRLSDQTYGGFNRLFNMATARTPDGARAFTGGNYLDQITSIMPDADALAGDLKKDLDARGIRVDQGRGPLNGIGADGQPNGMSTFIFKSRDVPGAIVRIAQSDDPPDSPIVLGSAVDLRYQNAGAMGQSFQVHIVPNAPGIGEVTPLDVVNSLRALKAQGVTEDRPNGWLDTTSDINAGQFIQLRDPSGNIIRYPDDIADENLRGRPVAYIRDLNMVQAKKENYLPMGNAPEEYLADLTKILHTGDWRADSENGKPVTRVGTAGLSEAEVGELAAAMKSNGFDPRVDAAAGRITLDGDDGMKLYAMRDELTPDKLPPAPPEALAAAGRQQEVVDKLKADLKAAGADITPQSAPSVRDPAVEEALAKVSDPKVVETLHNIRDPEIRVALEKHQLAMENFAYAKEHGAPNPDIPKETRAWADLSGKNLSGLDLSGLQLENIVLEGADLRNAKIEGTNLGGAELKGAKLDGASLRGTTLLAADLEDASFVKADLGPLHTPNGDLCTMVGYTNMTNTDFTGANMQRAGVVPDFTRGAQGAKFDGADLTGAEMPDAEFAGASFKGAILKGVKTDPESFTKAQLAEAKDVPPHLLGIPLPAETRDAILGLGDWKASRTMAGIEQRGLDTQGMSEQQVAAAMKLLDDEGFRPTLKTSETDPAHKSIVLSEGAARRLDELQKTPPPAPAPAAPEPPPEAMENDTRTPLDKAFDISRSQGGRDNAGVVRNNMLNVNSEFFPEVGELVGDVRKDLDRRNLHLDLGRGPLNPDGANALVFRVKGAPDAVGRLSMLDDPPESSIILKPAARLNYETPGGDKVQVTVVANAPDIGDVAPADIVNTLRVLKAEGNLGKVGDIRPDQFVYMKDEKGDLIRYPETMADPGLRGKPIAFLRDLNAAQDGQGAVGASATMGGAEGYFEKLQAALDVKGEAGTENGQPVVRYSTKDHDPQQINIEEEGLQRMGLHPRRDGDALVLNAEEAEKLRQAHAQLDGMRDKLSPESLTPAPPEAMAAAHQQDALAEKARAELKAAGADIEQPRPYVLGAKEDAAAEAASKPPAAARPVETPDDPGVKAPAGSSKFAGPVEPARPEPPAPAQGAEPAPANGAESAPKTSAPETSTLKPAPRAAPEPPAGASAEIPRSSFSEKLPRSAKAAGMSVASLNILVGGYGVYQGIVNKDAVGGTLGALNLATGFVQAAPKLAGRTAVGVAEKAGVPLMIAGGAYEVVRAPKGEKGAAAARAGLTTAAAGVAMAAGLTGAAALIVPLAAGAAAGLVFDALRNGAKVGDLERQHDARMEDIRPDTTNEKHLRAVADMVDDLVKKSREQMKAEGKTPPADDFVRTKDGKIDLHDEGNLKTLKSFMKDQHDQLQQAINNSDQLALLPEFTNDKKLAMHMALEESMKNLDTATAELNELRTRATPVDEAKKSPQQVMADIKKAEAQLAKNPNGPPEAVGYKYTVHREGPLGRSDSLVPADECNPPIPREVLDAWKANPDSGEPIRQMIYKKDAAGKLVPDKIVYWKIDDPQHPAAAAPNPLGEPAGPCLGGVASGVNPPVPAPPVPASTTPDSKFAASSAPAATASKPDAKTQGGARRDPPAPRTAAPS